MTEFEIQQKIESWGFKHHSTKMFGDSLHSYYLKDNLVIDYFFYPNGINPSWKHKFPELLLSMTVWLIGEDGEIENNYLTNFCAMSIYDKDVNDYMTFHSIYELFDVIEKAKFEDFYDSTRM